MEVTTAEDFIQKELNHHKMMKQIYEDRNNPSLYGQIIAHHGKEVEKLEAILNQEKQ